MFQSNRSIIVNSFKLTQSLKQNINKKFVTSAVFLDFEKAFDKVWHTGLLHKIKILYIAQNFLRWINSFLNERTMLIKIKIQEVKVFHLWVL